MNINMNTIKSFMTNDGLSLDSSELLNGGNYKGRIREVGLMETMLFSSLFLAQNHASKQGFYCYDMGIVNVVHGEPGHNEPRSALLFQRTWDTSDLGSGLAEALVMRESDHFAYYQLGSGFRYIE